ncbi:hypothetical protein [Thalassospira sp. TSL5-1]|uniref:hypothetical protein n=1 Tax=Thalassospira sp. TSL5-1 TaxID=1544451 RepID=UPI000938FE49|nr:hypothetical protein [Thalassospira sp. TSL5-1]OKH87066.1 hypothetical protein LF95_18910 [Thalassospira sp. TSL5-1]
MTALRSDELESIMLRLIVDEYEPQSILRLLNNRSEEYYEKTKNELRKVISERLWSRDDYESMTGIEIETDRQLYEHLEEVWQYAFNNGPEPEIEKYEY